MAQYYQVVSQTDQHLGAATSDNIQQQQQRHYYQPLGIDGQSNTTQTVQYVLDSGSDNDLQSHQHHLHPQQQASTAVLHTASGATMTFQPGQQIMVNNQLMVVDSAGTPSAVSIVDVDPSQLAGYHQSQQFILQDGPASSAGQVMTANGGASATSDAASAGGGQQLIFATNDGCSSGQQPIVINHVQQNSGSPAKIMLALQQPQVGPSVSLAQQTLVPNQQGRYMGAVQIQQSGQLTQRLGAIHQQSQIMSTAPVRAQTSGGYRTVITHQQATPTNNMINAAPMSSTIVQHGMPRGTGTVSVRQQSGATLVRAAPTATASRLVRTVGPGGISEMTHNNVQQNSDSELVQLSDGTLVTMPFYKQMLAQQSTAANAATNKPTPKRKADTTKSLPRKTPAAKRTSNSTGGAVMSAKANPAIPGQSNQPISATTLTRPATIGGAVVNTSMIQNQHQSPLQQQRSTLANYVPTQQIQDIIAKTIQNEQYNDSIRMLVLLENGEQRLITFTMPKEQCTIQEILEQVGVPYKQDTEIELVEVNYKGLNYVVGVGNVQVNTVQNTDAVAAGTTPFTKELAAPLTTHNAQSLPKLTLAQQQQQPPVKELSPSRATTPPKLFAGRLAVCNYCGYLSEDFNRCSRCKHKFSELVRAVTESEALSAGRKEMVVSKQQSSPANPAVAANKDVSSGLKKNNTPGNCSSKPSALNAANPRRKPSKPKIMEVEPVVLLSSEDEDETLVNIYEQMRKVVSYAPLSKKEPSLSEINDDVLVSEMDPKKADFQVSLKCRTIRVGSHRFQSTESFLMRSTNITFKAPTVESNTSLKTIIIDRRSIVKVLINFNDTMPVIFYYVKPCAARVVRELLCMVDSSSTLGSGVPYFDSLSTNESHRRITVLVDSFTEEKIDIIKAIYGDTLMEELTPQEANQILLQTCPRDLLAPTIENNPSEIKQLLIYPPGKGGISINTEDFMCLAQDQFLNDVIIDFYLKHLVLTLPEKESDKIHIFSTFFYKRLTTKPVRVSKKTQPTELDGTLSAAQKRHARVKNWTKNVDLFEKNFVVVPINESCHWFLAIICFPGMSGPHTMDNKPYKGDNRVYSRKSKTLSIKIEFGVDCKKCYLEKTLPASIGAVTITPVKKENETITFDDPASDKDEAEGDESEMDSCGNESDDNTKDDFALSEKVAIKQPCILIFDSLAGACRSRVVATLRDYLTCEFAVKRNVPRVFNKDIIKGSNLKVPQQTNYTDCGLYLLQYVESFLRNPLIDYNIPIPNMRKWFDELVVTRKREDISNLIKKLMVDYGKDIEMLPEIAFPTINGELRMEEDQEGDEDDTMKSTRVSRSRRLEEDSECENSNADIGKASMKAVSVSSSTSPPVSEPVDKAVSSTNPLATFSLGSAVTLTPTNTAAGQQMQVADSTTPFPLGSLPRDKPTTDRETMSYLKSKRIIRHKNVNNSPATDSSDPKKYKVSSSSPGST